MKNPGFASSGEKHPRIADGVIFAIPGIDGTDYWTRFFNSDGSKGNPLISGVNFSFYVQHSSEI